MFRSFMFLAMCFGAVAAFADDPPPPPAPTSTITVPKGVTGDGKRITPFVFDTSTKCYLSLPAVAGGDIKAPQWDLEDGPPDAELLGVDGRTVVFSLAAPGLYQVSVRWDGGGFGKAWLEVAGSGPSPPGPTPPINTIAARVKASLVGPDSKSDAGKLAAICDQIVEELSGTAVQETADLFDTWEAAFSGDNKLKGAYPALIVALKELLPPTGSDSVAISADDRSRFIALFKAVAAAAKEVARG